MKRNDSFFVFFLRPQHNNKQREATQIILAQLKQF